MKIEFFYKEDGGRVGPEVRYELYVGVLGEVFEDCEFGENTSSLEYRKDIGWRVIDS